MCPLKGRHLARKCGIEKRLTHLDIMINFTRQNNAGKTPQSDYSLVYHRGLTAVIRAQITMKKSNDATTRIAKTIMPKLSISEDITKQVGVSSAQRIHCVWRAWPIWSPPNMDDLTVVLDLPVGMRLLYLISLIHIWTFKAD
jgi:hypothetical protein